VSGADVDVAVIGAGVVGAAVAQRLAAAGKSVAVLEQGQRPAEGVTSRNSGVIHSGLYYPAGSLKTRLCIEGQALLYDWCAQKRVPHRKCRKYIVALDGVEEALLAKQLEHAQRCGARGVRWVQEAPVRAVAALEATETGIVDAAAFTHSLLDDARENGALVLTGAKVTGLSGAGLETTRGPLRAAQVVNAAGLFSDHVARLAGVDRYTLHPWRGDYFTLHRRLPFEALIYPVKPPGAPGLGIHLTIDLGGRWRRGPDFEPATSRDDFRAAEHKHAKFFAAAKRLLGDVREDELSWESAGIRPKLRAPHEAEERDFVISKDLPWLVNLIGIESPGLTAALAIGREVERLLSG
jgi:L-2-hydroxyglutarate oxidase LhgO